MADRIRELRPGTEVELVTIRTTGDVVQDASLAQIGGKGLFIKEIEESLLKGAVDIAVHSMKDLPAEIPEGLEIAAVPPREDPRDVLISRDGRELDRMPSGARIGTGSLRRGIQIKNRMPAVAIVPLRGNLDTRIRKIETENLDGVILAAAGLRRMGWEARISQFIPVETMLPAVGQGALGIEIRRADKRAREAVARLHDPLSGREVGAERAFLKGLGGGCQFPIAGFAKLIGKRLVLEGMVGSPDGRTMIRRKVEGAAEDGEGLGEKLAGIILALGGRDLLDGSAP